MSACRWGPVDTARGLLEAGAKNNLNSTSSRIYRSQLIEICVSWRICPCAAAHAMWGCSCRVRALSRVPGLYP